MAQTHSIDLESGSSQYAYTDSDSIAQSGSFTIMMWVKHESVSQVFYSHRRSTAGTGNENWYFLLNNGNQLYFGGTNIGGDATFSWVPKVGVWYHICAVFDDTGNETRLYINGQLVDTTAATGTPTASTSVRTTIGANSSGTSNFDGRIKDARIFNTALTQAQIVSYAHTENAPTTNLVAEWNFNDALTSTVNSYTLTGSGSPTFFEDIPWTAPTDVSTSELGRAVISDDFNRSDSTTVGGGWSEGSAGSGSNAEIASNKLKISGTNSGESVVYQAQKLTRGFTASCEFTPQEFTTAGAYAYFKLFNDGTRRAGYGLRMFPGGSIEITDANGTSETVKATGSTTLTSGGSVTYRIDLEVTKEGWMHVYIWDKSGSRPSSPTLSWTNSGSAYTPASTGTNVAFGWVPNEGTTKYVLYDNFSIRASLLSNLVAYWNLDEASGTREDSHGSNDLTDNNTVGSATGKKSNGADFESANSERLSISNANQSGLYQTGDQSIAFWYKPESFAANHGFFTTSYGNGGANTEGVRFLRETSNGMWMQITNGGTDNNYNSWTDPTFSNGTWYHVVFVFRDDKTCELFVDAISYGVISGSGSLAPGTPNQGAALGAAAPDGQGWYLDAVMDECSFYSRALDYGEILDLYNAGNAITYVEPEAAATDNAFFMGANF